MRKIEPGDVLNSPNETDSRFKHVVKRIHEDGLVEFHGDPDHRYSVDHMVKVHGEKARMMRGIYGVKA